MMALEAVSWAAPDALIYDASSRKLALAGRVLVTQPQTATVLFHIMAGQGRFLSVSELIDALYGDREDGGPDAAFHVVVKRVVEARRIANQYGLCLLNAPGRGWYAAEPFREAAE